MICPNCNFIFKNGGAFKIHTSTCILNADIIKSIISDYSINHLSIRDLNIKYSINKNIIRKILKLNNCIRSLKEAYIIRANRYKYKTSNETKEKLRIARLKWMKENPEKTSWRKANISYPESVFLKKCRELKLDENYLIIREKSIFPYFIDFAFDNEKIAVEIDGSQHLLEERKKSDIKKDKLLNDSGWRVIRFTAYEVVNNINNCIIELEKFLKNDTLNNIKVGIYKNIECNKIKLSCHNCDVDIYKIKSEINKSKTGIFFCSNSCSTSFHNKKRCKIKKLKTIKKNGFTEFEKNGHRKERKVERPPYEQLLNEVNEFGYSAIGRKYGVCDNSIKKWIKMYEKHGKDW